MSCFLRIGKLFQRGHPNLLLDRCCFPILPTFFFNLRQQIRCLDRSQRFQAKMIRILSFRRHFDINRQMKKKAYYRVISFFNLICNAEFSWLLRECMGSREKIDFFILFNLLLTGKLNGGFVSIRSAILIVAFSVYYCDTVYFFASLVSISVVHFFSFR